MRISLCRGRRALKALRARAGIYNCPVSIQSQRPVDRPDVSDLQLAGDLSQIKAMLFLLSRPFGDLLQMQCNYDETKRRVRCYLALDDRSKHPALAFTLGGIVHGREVILEIPVPEDFVPRW